MQNKNLKRPVLTNVISKALEWEYHQESCDWLLTRYPTVDTDTIEMYMLENTKSSAAECVSSDLSIRLCPCQFGHDRIIFPRNSNQLAITFLMNNSTVSQKHIN